MIHKHFFIGFTVVLLLVGTGNAEAVHPSWGLDTLYTQSMMRNLSMAIDSTGVIHIGYTDGSPRVLRHGMYDQGMWSSDSITLGGYGPMSIAVSPSGEPVIAFIVRDTLHIARTDSGSWSIEKPEPEYWDWCNEGFNPIALDDTGGVHILYRKYCNEYWYAWEESGAWHQSVVHANSWQGADLTIGATGAAEIAIASRIGYGSSGELMVLTRDGAGWIEELVDTVRAPWRTHLSHNPSGDPEIVTTGWSDLGEEWCFRVEHWQSGGGAWSSHHLDSDCLDDLNEGGTVSSAGFEIDSRGVPHILMDHVDYKGLHPDSLPISKLIYTSTNVGTWFEETILEIPYGTVASLVLDQEEVPVVAYALPGLATAMVIARRDFTPTGLPPGSAARLDLLLSPNPAHSGNVQLEIPLLSSGPPLEVAIYDVRGRLARTLLTAASDNTRLSLTWDGRSDRGKELPAGVYFVRARAGSQTSAAKLVLLR